jgi:hypothetical protein
MLECSAAEGSHSGLVRAPAKRLSRETGIEGSNPSPSAILMSIITRIVDFLRGPSDDGRPPRLPSPDALTLLTRPNGEPEAVLLRGILEQQGIHSMIRNRDAATAQSGALGPPWAYELWVLRKDLKRAREALEIEDEAE